MQKRVSQHGPLSSTAEQRDVTQHFASGKGSPCLGSGGVR